MRKWINWKTVLSGAAATILAGCLIWAFGIAGDTVAECKKVEIYRGECLKTDERVELIETEFRNDIKQILVDNAAQKSDTKAIRDTINKQDAAISEIRSDIKELLREVKKSPHH